MKRRDGGTEEGKKEKGRGEKEERERREGGIEERRRQKGRGEKGEEKSGKGGSEEERPMKRKGRRRKERGEKEFRKKDLERNLNTKCVLVAGKYRPDKF